MPKVVIFDFDGTLADVAEIVREIYDEQSQRRGWPKLTDAEYKRLRKGTVREAMRWVGVKSWQLPGLLRFGRKAFHDKSGEIKLFPGVPDVLEALHKDGWQIYILSTNSPDTIREILSRYKLDSFVTILKRSGMFGKAASINKLVKKQGYSKRHVWMVGDEIRDMEAAKKSGVNSVGVAWGLQDGASLKKYKPDYLAKKPSEIVEYLKMEAKA